MNDNAKLKTTNRAPGAFAEIVSAVEALQASRLKRRMEETQAHAATSGEAGAEVAGTPEDTSESSGKASPSGQLSRIHRIAASARRNVMLRSPLNTAPKTLPSSNILDEAAPTPTPEASR